MTSTTDLIGIGVTLFVALVTTVARFELEWLARRRERMAEYAEHKHQTAMLTDIRDRLTQKGYYDV